jgi:hypothetical protein
MRIRLLLSLAVAAAAAAPLGLAGPAVASSDGVQGIGAYGAFGSPSFRSSPPLPSQYEAAYELAGSFSTVKLTTKFVVPDLKKCGTAKRAIAPAVATSQAAVGLFVGCVRGKAHYFPVFRIGGPKVTKYSSSAAHAGDQIVLTETGNSTQVSVSLIDKTHPGVSHTRTGPGTPSFGNLEIGDSAWGKGPWGVPDFGVITFSASKLNGHPFGSQSGLVRFNMVNSSATLQIKTTPFASDHESFKTDFKHS